MKIGEIDRARAIFAHCANICNPDVHIKFWNKWKDFETEHGNEDTIREMLRVKRQVAATHNTQGLDRFSYDFFARFLSYDLFRVICIARSFFVRSSSNDLFRTIFSERSFFIRCLSYALF